MSEVGNYQEPFLLLPQHYMTLALFSLSAGAVRHGGLPGKEFKRQKSDRGGAPLYERLPGKILYLHEWAILAK